MRAARPAPVLLAIALALVVVGCGSSSDGASPSTTTRKATTTTEATTTTDAASDADVEDGLVDGYLDGVRGSLLDADIPKDDVDCVVDALRKGMDEDLEGPEMYPLYDDCGVGIGEIVGAQLASEMVDNGVSEEAATCVRKLVAAVDTDEVDAFLADEDGFTAKAIACGVPADMFPG